MKKEFIAYKGSKYTIEWYFDSRDRSIALEYFDSLPKTRRNKLLLLLEVMAEIGKISNREKFVHEEDKIFAFKPSPDRFLCFFFTGAKIIITNAYEKKSQKMPPREKKRALKYQKDYIKRVKERTYYE